MAFRLPSVIVYQELLSTTVNPVTPFMDLCIVGPLYQVNEDAACADFAQLTNGDEYVAAYPDVTLGAVIDKDSVVVEASDVYVRIWPTLNSDKIVGKVKLVNYERELNTDGTFKKDETTGDYVYSTTQDEDDEGKTVTVKIPSDTTSVYCDFTEQFSEANIFAGDYLELTFTYPAVSEDDEPVQEVVKAKISKIDEDANGDMCITLAKSVEDLTEVEGVTCTAVVMRATGEDTVIDSDYLSIEDEEFSINWIQRLIKDPVTGETISATNEPPLITSDATDDPAPLYRSSIKVTYRALRQDLVNDFTTITSYSNAEAKLGKVNIKNPLSVAAQIINSAIGQMTYRVLPIESDDYNGYSKALDILANNEKVYCIVPLTDNQNVISAYATHCKNMSVALKSKWRIMYGSLAIDPVKIVVDLNPGRITYFDDDTVLIKDVADGKFVTNNCRISDFVDIYDGNNKYLYSLQLTGIINETTAKFSRVLWERTEGGYQTQIDDNGDDVKMSTQDATCRKKANCVVNATYKVREMKYQVVRVLDNEGLAEKLSGVAESYKNKRLRLVMPDTIMIEVNDVTESVGGEYLCVALGAMRTGLPPHQGFSTMGISGISRILNANKSFTEDQLTEMAHAGVFWVAQDDPDELPYVLYQTTTDNTQLETQEDSIVATIDYASKFYKDNLKNVLGRYNVNSISMNYVKTVINACSDEMVTTSYEYIGPILTSATLTALTSEADHIYPTIKIEVPYPVNGVDVTLQV